MDAKLLSNTKFVNELRRYICNLIFVNVWGISKEDTMNKTQHCVGFRKNAIIMIIPLKIITDNYSQITLG